MTNNLKHEIFDTKHLTKHEYEALTDAIYEWLLETKGPIEGFAWRIDVAYAVDEEEHRTLN